MRFNQFDSIFFSRKLILFNRSGYLEVFKPCGYFLKIKKDSGKFKVTQGSFWSLKVKGRFFDLKSSNPVFIKNKILKTRILFLTVFQQFFETSIV